MRIVYLFLLFLWCIVSLKAQTFVVDTMNNKTYTTCSGTFTDGTGNYTNNENYVTTFCSSSGLPLKFDFSTAGTFSMAAGTGDSLFFYNGTSATGTPIAILTAADDYGFSELQLNTLSTCVTIKWKSDAATVAAGWSAVISCGNVPSCSGNLNPPPSDIFGQAPLICNLNGYCGTTSSYYGEDSPYNFGGTGGGCPTPTDGLFGGTLQNNSWLAFIADASTATFKFVISGGGSCNGVQAGIFEFDPVTGLFTRKSPCNFTSGSGMAVGTSTLTATGLIVGQIYYLMMDGNAGSVCDYTISASAGVGVVNAGRDTTLCITNNNFILNATPAGTGIWSVISGSGTFTNPTNSTTSVSGLSLGVNQFSWTATSSCANTKDTIAVNVTGFVTANAGIDKQLSCTVTSVTIGTPAVVGNTYVWTPATGLSATNIAQPTATSSGTFILTVTNTASGCVGKDTVVVSNLLITETHSNATCSASNGSIDVSVSGGVFPYTYLWNDGAVTQDRTGLAPASYSVVVTDNTGCSSTLNITISNATANCVCGGTFMDSGGSAGAYSNNENTVTTYCSTNGLPLSFSFSGGSNSFDIDQPGDTLFFYAGTVATGTPIAILTYLDDANQTFYSSQLKIATLSTCVTTRFKSNSSGTDAGWVATVACEAPPTCAGNPPASDIFGQAPLICNLNGYCGTTSSYYGEDTPYNLIGGGDCSSGPDDFIFGGTIENNSWLSFIADATTASFNFTISNCGAGSGLQIGIFGFNGTNFSLKSQCATTDGSQTGNTTINATGLTIGQKYYIMIDGASGSTCDYIVSANSGVITVNAGPDQSFCGNSTILAASSSLGTGIWTVKRGSGVFADATSPNTTVSGLSFGQNVFTWTSTNVSCSASSSASFDTVIINVTCTLPVELSAFNAKCNEGYTEVVWETVTEKNNDYFLLDRASDDLNFETIATIKGSGNSTSPKYYSFKDYKSNEINYYKLVQVDFDGTRTNSKLILSKNNCKSSFLINNLYYNHTTNEVVVSYTSEVNQTSELNIFDVLGKLIYSGKYDLTAGKSEFKIPINNLSNGIHICSVKVQDINIVKKIVVNSK
jgi:hypothetical protein